MFPFVSFFWTNDFVHFFLIIDIYASLQMLFDFLSKLFHLQFCFLKGLQLLQLLYSMLFLKPFSFLFFPYAKKFGLVFFACCVAVSIIFFFNFFSILSLSDSRSYPFTYTHSLCSIEYLLFCIYYL